MENNDWAAKWLHQRRAGGCRQGHLLLGIEFKLIHILVQHSLNERHIVEAHLLGCGRVATGEMEAVGEMLEKERLKVGQGVVLAKESPHFITHLKGKTELMLFHPCELVNEMLVNDEVLMAITTSGLVRLRSDTWCQKFGHLEVRITQQGRFSYVCGRHLTIERATAVAHYEVDILVAANTEHLVECFLRMQRKIGSEYPVTAFETLAKLSGHVTAATGEETVKKENGYHNF